MNCMKTVIMLIWMCCLLGITVASAQNASCSQGEKIAQNTWENGAHGSPIFHWFLFKTKQEN